MCDVPTADVLYRYSAASSLSVGAGGVALGLSTTDPGTFMDGFAERADVVAAALLLVGRVAATRFSDPMTAARLAELADPIITVGEGAVRFESLSACCGVAARLDLLPDGLDVTVRQPGTTNVDLGPAMRRLLDGVLPRDPLHLGVGESGLRVATLDGQVHERRVALPDRWVRSLAELQVLASRMVPRVDLDARQLRAFLRSLPPSTPPRSTFWAQPAAGGLRLGSQPVPGAVPLGGPERLRVVEPLLRHTRAVRVYAAGGDGPRASWWELELPHARLGVALSPGTSRGFSGEGAVLDGIGAAGTRDADAARGRLGYDLAEGRHFARLLPVGRDLLEQHPRHVRARALVDAGAVRREGDHHLVRGSAADHVVRLGPPGDRCTCPWYGEHRGTRGPCAHVVAVRLVLDGSPDPDGRDAR